MPNIIIISKVLKSVTFISGLVLFVIQIKAVWDNFVMERTAFGTSKETLEKIAIPPIILCPEILDVDMTMADPDLFLDQFYMLNDEIMVKISLKGISFKLEMDLKLGQNFDQQGELFMTLKELWHPSIGLCYVLVPNSRRLGFGPEDALFVSIFLNGQKGYAVKLLLYDEENVEFMNFPDFGRQTPVMSILDGGTRMGIGMKKSIRQQMSSKGKLQI